MFICNKSFILIIFVITTSFIFTNDNYAIKMSKIIKLPQPKYDGSTSLEQALLKRRSIRNYSKKPLSINEVSQLLWSAQGITDKEKSFRTVPSAGALYPVETYLIVNNVENVEQGIYKYDVEEHKIVMIRKGYFNEQLSFAALNQSCVKDASVIVILCADYAKTTRRYGDRGIKYVHIEIGHSAQNVQLQTVSLNLGSVVVGAFDDEKVKKILNISNTEHPLYIIPIGKL